MNAEVMQPPQLSTGRLLLLGVSSVILCISFIMSVFAPFPLALAIILYGRTKGYLTCLAGLIVSFVFSLVMYQSFTLFGFYAVVLIFGVAIAEIVQRNISPVRGMVSVGLLFIGLLSAGFGLLLNSQNLTTKQFIVQQLEKSAAEINEQKKIIEQSADKESFQLLQLLEQPDLLAKEMMESFPSYLFMIVFLMLWFNMFLVLKSRRLLLSAQDYQHSERDLLGFKVPFPFVMLLALGLVLAVWGTDLGAAYYETIGFTIIKVLGIFYFFQGFGVFSDLLSFMGIGGFFRTLIVMLVIFTANYLVAAAGLFDNWFDFRKYFVKRKTED